MEKKIKKSRKINVTTLSLLKTSILFNDANMPINLKFPYFKAKEDALNGFPRFNSRDPEGYISIDCVKYVKVGTNSELIGRIDFGKYEKLGFEVPKKFNKSKKYPRMSYICMTIDLFKVAVHEIIEGEVYIRSISQPVCLAPYVESIQLLDANKKILTYCINS